MFVSTPSIVATVTLALAAVVLGQSVPTSESSSATSTTFPASSTSSSTSVSPSATSAPYVPTGGLETNGTPVYAPMSAYDYQSISLALIQAWLEVDLFRHGLARYSVDEFNAAGLDIEIRTLIEYMAEQQTGHATLLSNILGASAAQPCNYTYPYSDVREFVDFSQKILRVGESSVYGFLEHLDSRSAASLVLQSVAIDGRQQMIFRQLLGLFPMPVWFEPAITQSMAWTILSPFITSCPAGNLHVVFQNFPPLLIVNNPSVVGIVNTTLEGNSTLPAVTHNHTIPLSAPGRLVQLMWKAPGDITGYNNSFTTNATVGNATFVAWISQLNTTYTPLFGINGTSGFTLQPNGSVFGDNSTRIVNGTMFLAITDSNVFVTPFNISAMDAHVVAGPAVYQAG